VIVLQAAPSVMMSVDVKTVETKKIMKKEENSYRIRLIIKSKVEIHASKRWFSPMDQKLGIIQKAVDAQTINALKSIVNVSNSKSCALLSANVRL